MRNLFLLNPFKYGLFSWQLFSHKLCRWFVPFFMIFAFLSNASIMFKSIPISLIFIFQLIVTPLDFITIGTHLSAIPSKYKT